MAFVPSCWALAIIDVLFFVVVPLVGALAFVQYFKRHVSGEGKGAWRACGAAWMACFWLSMLLMALVYLGVKDVLTMERLGFVEAYRAALPEIEEGSSAGNIVRFFYLNYCFLHPFFFTLVDVLFLGWFFWPGFAMRKQGIKL